MADYSFVDVTALGEVPGGVQRGDALLLVRPGDDGTQTCYRVDGGTFKGADGRTAYDVAVEQGYTGSLADWEAQIGRASRLGVAFDSEQGEIVINT